MGNGDNRYGGDRFGGNDRWQPPIATINGQLAAVAGRTGNAATGAAADRMAADRMTTTAASSNAPGSRSAPGSTTMTTAAADAARAMAAGG
jgi:hypothetical protein